MVARGRIELIDTIDFQSALPTELPSQTIYNFKKKEYTLMSIDEVKFEKKIKKNFKLYIRHYNI